MSTLQLSEIGLKAVAWQRALEAKRDAQMHLRDACYAYKSRNALGYIGKTEPHYEAMLEATKPEYLALEKAKGAERNARTRLERACKKVAT